MNSCTHVTRKHTAAARPRMLCLPSMLLPACGVLLEHHCVTMHRMALNTVVPAALVKHGGIVIGLCDPREATVLAAQHRQNLTRWSSYDPT